MPNIFKFKTKREIDLQTDIDRFEDAMDIIKQWMLEGGELPTEIYLDKEN
jgi:hypothetical protein